MFLSSFIIIYQIEIIHILFPLVSDLKHFHKESFDLFVSNRCHCTSLSHFQQGPHVSFISLREK